MGEDPDGRLFFVQPEEGAQNGGTIK